MPLLNIVEYNNRHLNENAAGIKRYCIDVLILIEDMRIQRLSYDHSYSKFK